jgi:hypothetical protein
MINNRAMKHISPLFTLGLLAAGMGAFAAIPSQTHAQPQSQAQAPQKDPDWPCVQVLVPELSAASVWDGPAIEDLKADWRSDPKIQALVQRAVNAVSPASLEPEFQALAESAGPDRNRALTLLFAGVYETLNEERVQSIESIRRYARHQRLLRERIDANLKALDALPADAPERKELDNAITLDRRVLDDRHRSLGAVCEQPVLAEQKLGTIARMISPLLE